MASDALQRFMSSGLLENVDSDEMFQSLEKAVSALAKSFQAAPRDVVTATLLSLDGHASVEEPMFDKAEEQIVAHWKTFRGRYRDRPRSILRAVLLAALDAASDTDAVALCAWQTAASLLPVVSLGREDKPIRELFATLARRSEEIALARFSTEPDAEVPGLPKLDASKLKVDVDKLAVRVAATVGPGTNLPGATLKEPNPHWPNSHQAWAYEYVPRMTATIADAALESAKLTSGALQEQLRTVLKGLTDIVGRENGIRLQVQVLGWAQALYSSSLGRSYRSLDPAIAAVAMANDLCTTVGAPCPGSVVFTIGEAARRAVSGDEARPLSKFLDAVASQRGELGPVVPKCPVTAGRTSLGAMVSALVHGDSDRSLVSRERLGVEPEISLNVADFAMWCFRDFQVMALVGEPT